MMKSATLAAVFPVVALLGAATLAQNGQVAATQRSEWITFNPVTPLTAESFARPPAADRPWVRMNMPSTADPTEIATEIRELPDHGIAGVEIGQGAFPNNEQLVALFRAANQVGIKVSLSHGPTQNPAGYSIDDDHARKTLVVGKAVVNPGETFDGHVPPPTLTAAGRSGFGGLPQGGRGPGAGAAGRAAGGGRAAEGPPAGGGIGGRGGAGGRGAQPSRATLIAAMAYRCTQTPCAPTGPAELDRSSVIDLTPAVSGRNTSGVLGGTSAGDIRWTAPSSPSGAQWQLIAFWSRGVFAQPDPFSDEGYAQLVNSMEAGLSAEVKELMKANRGDLFYDSHSSDRGSPDELWTNKMVAAGCAGICGLLPAFVASRRNVVDVLRRGVTPAPRELGLRRVFVTGEVALACVLLVSLTLVSRSLHNVLNVDPGFEARGVLTLQVSVPAASYASDEQVASFYSALHSALEERLGPRTISIVNEIPLTGDRGRRLVRVRPTEPDAKPWCAKRGRPTLMSCGYPLLPAVRSTRATALRLRPALW